MDPTVRENLTPRVRKHPRFAELKTLFYGDTKGTDEEKEGHLRRRGWYCWICYADTRASCLCDRHTAEFEARKVWRNSYEELFLWVLDNRPDYTCPKCEKREIEHGRGDYLCMQCRYGSIAQSVRAAES
jgi:hypothetical protein